MERFKVLAMEPERANMCIMIMQYLILMRPLVRGLALDAIEQMWRGERLKEAKGQAEKVMRKRRPDVLEQPPQEKVGIVDVSVNGLNAAPVPVEVRSLDPRKRGLDQYTDNGGYVESIPPLELLGPCASRPHPASSYPPCRTRRRLRGGCRHCQGLSTCKRGRSSSRS
jgi:hypothetical protein